MADVNHVEYNSNTLIDLREDTVTPENLLYGIKAHAANGSQITGAIIINDKAEGMSYDNTVSHLEADNVQTAIDALNDNLNNGLIGEMQRAMVKESELESSISDEETRARAAETGISAIATGNSDAIAVLNGTGEGSVSKTVADKIAEIIDGAPESFDTLKEISDWINSHTKDAAAMNTAIQNNTSAISAHTDRTDNPHSVTKAQLGLGNVENKSSAAIRDEITKKNVTDALGYTPPESDTTYGIATQQAAGLESAADKTKLDGITDSADAVSFTRSLTSGTKIGTININGKDIEIYAPSAESGDSVAFTQGLTSGTLVGTLNINGTEYQLYAPTNTDTHWTTHLYAGTGSAANASSTNGNTKITLTDNSTVRNSVGIKGTGGTTVTSDASGNITINSESASVDPLGEAETITFNTDGSIKEVLSDGRYMVTTFPSDAIQKTVLYTSGGSVIETKTVTQNTSGQIVITIS